MTTEEAGLEGTEGSEEREGGLLRKLGLSQVCMWGSSSRVGTREGLAGIKRGFYRGLTMGQRWGLLSVINVPGGARTQSHTARLVCVQRASETPSHLP